MRSPCDDFTAMSDNVDEIKVNGNNNSAIPYHARENSLPFCYGQINKTSTPLRSTSGGTGVGAGGPYRNHDVGAGTGGSLDFGFNLSSSPSKADVNNDHFYGNNYNNGLTATLKSTTTTAKSLASGSGTDTTNTIKSQPRLTSPILVRKTLSSRSPTRNGTTNTNTIANTYHYKYGSANDSDSGHGNTLNGNISSYNNGYGSTNRNNNNNNNYKYNPNYNNSSNFGVGDTIDSSIGVRKTQPRSDFEELLRERREKVLREHYLSTGPTPKFSGGSSVVSASANQQKFNYDFEFHLNLDDAPPPPRRAYTMDRTSLQQTQEYRTRDIPAARDFATPTANEMYVERNYHTISSSNTNREAGGAHSTSQQQPQAQRQQQQQQQLESLYSTVERRTVQPSQPSQQQYLPTSSPSQPQKQQRAEYSPYGNGNASGYGFTASNEYAANNRSSLGAAVVARSRNDFSSPIYATTSKQVAATKSTYHSRNTFEPDSSTTDHPTVTSLAIAPSPTAIAVAAGKISPSPSYVARPETPAFPVTPRTPYGAYNGKNSPMGFSHSPGPQRPDLANDKSVLDLHNYSSETIYRTSCRQRLDSNMSLVNSEPQEVAAHLVKFAKDSSKYWYKPNLSREEAVQLLLNAEPGTFIVRNSTTYKDNYGLVVRVHQPPPNSELTGQPDDLVRHFLIEPTKHGVRLKSCANEPVFTSLSALIYEHSINKLALPYRLRIPDHDLMPSLIEPTSAQKQLLTQGAACNVLWLYSCETESLTGEEAIRKAIRLLHSQQPLPVPTEVHFKVTQQGITLTDNTRKKFFRKHYPGDSISFCAIDPDHRLWTVQPTDEVGSGKGISTVGALKKSIFAFVARCSPKSKDNQCHVFCDLDIHQPASAIVSFANKTLPTEKERNFVL